MASTEAELDSVLRSAFATHRDLPALWLEGVTHSYAELMDAATLLAARIADQIGSDETVGVLAQRSYAAYVGVLAAVLAGRAYVPINMKFPLERQRSIAEIGRCAMIVFDDYSKKRCGELLHALGEDVIQVSPAPGEVGEGGEVWEGPPIDGAALAYIMFTSGTTGTPKGVAVRRENLAAYLRAISKVAPLAPGVRCTQLFDLSFDLSVHDIFQTWASGGCLYVMGDDEALDPVGFAARHKLQAWFSVPSVVAMAKRLKRLTPDKLPELRLGLFCGEPLPMSLAAEWAEVAPNARILNLYGPTEATIAITAQAFDASNQAADRPATVPLGQAFDQCAAVVVGDDKKPADVGELWLGGAQITNGYINNAEEQAHKFVDAMLPGYAYERWYRTGDLVRRDSDYGLVFQGRLDDQVKIQGYRVELLEIEEVLRRACGASEVAAAPWPISETGSAEGIVAFVCGSAKTDKEIIAGCRGHLPSYMTPRRIIVLDTLPLNANGKVDRNALRRDHLVSNG